ncbi:cytochrome aa3 quinol oxidase, subunit IV, qoxD [Pediococcus stilesii]|uniref:Cytochrome aa3 quinol oxidase, subunit IV, qoxD n=1 Tax=Pediococcus stilesii TaxID=331679 RepID=A0A5R9BTG0_9LACO|nr:cytochrome aa3 quinol oxidase, subunit IV, qoxD [Pediococcus stilesii]
MKKKNFYRSGLILLILSTIIMVMTWQSSLNQTNKLIIIVIVGVILSWYIQYFSARLTDDPKNRRKK